MRGRMLHTWAGGSRGGRGTERGRGEEGGEGKGREEKRETESPIYKVKLPIISLTPTETVSAPRDRFLLHDDALNPIILP